MGKIQASQSDFLDGSDQPFMADAELLSANDQLADAIAFDGVECVRRSIEVTLDRYRRAVPDLQHRPEPLDAAIASVLLYLASVHNPGDASPADTLAALHPEIKAEIHEAAALSSVIPDTGGFLATLRGPARTLPADFGPLLHVGTAASRYELLSRLGGGAFGEVFLARDRVLSEEAHPALVAVKILRQRQPEHNPSFLRPDEATQSRRINHPNVVKVFDRGIAPSGDSYIVYEYIDSGTLSHFVRRSAKNGPLPIQHAVTLIAKIARGLQAAHSEGIIHCDLKPGNVLLTKVGEPKLGDFGIATSSDSTAQASTAYGPSAILGNLAFISPEQFRREPGCITISTDIYALGGMLYWLVTGKLPNGSSIEQITATHSIETGRRHAPSPSLENPAIDCDLNMIITRALSPGRAARHQSAGEFAADLESWLARLPIAWTKPGPCHQLALFYRRNPLVTGFIAALTMLLIGLVLLLATLSSRNRSLAVEQQIADTNRRQLIAARIQVQGLFGELSARQNKYKNLDPTATVTPQEIRETFNFAQSVWASSLGEPDRLVPLILTAADLSAMQLLVLRTEIVCWLVSLSGHQVAIPAITALQQEWAKYLDPNDEFLLMLETLSDCAEANRLMESLSKSQPSESRTALLGAARASQSQLLANLASLDHAKKSGNFQILCLQKLILLNGHNALNNPIRAAEFTKQYMQIVTQNSVPGVETIQLEPPL